MYRHRVGGCPTERPVLMHTWNTFTVHLRQRFGQRVQKIPLDAGASCPNRDGTLSRAGCTFCNAIGSGSGLGLAGMNLPAQWEYWREHFRKSNRASLFLAYLQSFPIPTAPPRGLRRCWRFSAPCPISPGFPWEPGPTASTPKNGSPRSRAVERKMA